jgi:hypothetical protein
VVRLVNYDLADFWSGKKVKQKVKLSVPKLKVWSTFSKVVGVGNAHKYFSFTQSNGSQTACRLVTET